VTRSVMLLGAGASAASDFHLPTMSGFFATDLSAQPELAKFLATLYPGQPPEAYNLEEVLGFVDLSRNRDPLWALHAGAVAHRIDARLLFDLLFQYVRLRLAPRMDRACSLHTRLFKSLEPRDSIVTLNYDLVADKTLQELERTPDGKQPAPDSRWVRLGDLINGQSFIGWQPVGLMPNETENGFYLKLHGSLDWIYCPTRECPNHQTFFPTNLSNPAGSEEGKPCRSCGTSLRTFLIPPVAVKRLDDSGRLALLWNLTLREIQRADRLVVIGVSFAPSDFELRWLLRQAVLLRDSRSLEVHLVNPSDDDRAEARKILPGIGHAIIEYDSVEKYLAHVGR